MEERFTPILRIPTTSDALLRIYPDKCTLSAAACRLLGISPDERTPRIQFYRDADERSSRTTVYIGMSRDSTGYVATARRKGSTRHIYGRSLAKSIAERLQGFGTYRIDPDTRVTSASDGPARFEVFFRKYE